MINLPYEQLNTVYESLQSTVKSDQKILDLSNNEQNIAFNNH